ncbi:hypothetical protein QEG73_22775 [Chitinophagaceae bacterium 26-R-25]|nr:hypothetical protein [Chitinophagaceae bacterium 26-R-25]
MEQSKIDYKKIRPQIAVKYGVELDEISITILSVLVMEQKMEFELQNKKLDTAIKKMEGSQEALQVDKEHPYWQAFWFGMGKWGIGICLAVCFSVIFYCIHLSKNRENENLNRQVNWCHGYIDVLRKGSKKESAEFLKKNPYPEE